jgi:DNA-binding response OmpR family regulator
MNSFSLLLMSVVHDWPLNLEYLSFLKKRNSKKCKTIAIFFYISFTLDWSVIRYNIYMKDLVDLAFFKASSFMLCCSSLGRWRLGVSKKNCRGLKDMDNKKAAILVVEDDPAIINGLLDVLVFNGYQAEGAEDGAIGLEKALTGKYDLVLLDVMLPSLDGFSICKQLRAKYPEQAIMMLTAKGAEDDLLNGFSAGADDYVAKPFSLRELMVRIEALLRRSGKNPGDEQLELAGICFDGAKLFASAHGETIEITRREMDIISYLKRHQDRIVSKKELLEKVWHYKVADIETRTVDIHILKLRKKIKSLIDEQVIVTVRGEGYRL